MTPVFQTRFGDDGNCWPACLASILEVPLGEVDHLRNGRPTWGEEARDYLKNRGLFFLQVSRNDDGSWPINAMPNDTLVILATTLADGNPHSVIARTKIKDLMMTLEVVHDPMFPPIEIVDHEALIFLCRLDQYEANQPLSNPPTETKETVEAQV